MQFTRLAASLESVAPNLHNRPASVRHIIDQRLIGNSRQLDEGRETHLASFISQVNKHALSISCLVEMGELAIQCTTLFVHVNPHGAKRVVKFVRLPSRVSQSAQGQLVVHCPPIHLQSFGDIKTPAP